MSQARVLLVNRTNCARDHCHILGDLRAQFFYIRNSVWTRSVSQRLCCQLDQYFVATRCIACARAQAIQRVAASLFRGPHRFRGFQA